MIKVESDLNEAIKLSPQSTNALNNRGSLYLEQKQFDKAIKDFSSLIVIDPSLAEAYYNRSQAYEGKGNKTLALKDLRRAQELNPDIYKD